MSDFDVFKNRWEITARINLVTPLRIGGGQNAGTYSLSQAPVLLSYDAKSQTAEPFIPGSSLKGVLRSTVERLIRTFNKDESCISVTNIKDGNVLCGKGKCISCSIFGSMKTGAKIRVHDCFLSNGTSLVTMLDERPHCATSYKVDNDYYKKQMQTGRNKNMKVPKTNPRFEEVVVSDLSFDVSITLDNADEHEVGLILLALDEFNYKRCHLGGGASRGHGFIDVTDVTVNRKTIKNNDEIYFGVLAEPQDLAPIKRSVRDYLRDIDNEVNPSNNDFDVYYNAYSPAEEESGNVVFEYEVTAIGDFHIPGADAATVTNSGVPIIPGSTIKGFLRHRLIDENMNAKKIDDICGAANKENSHRSRLIISDAYPAEDFYESDKIPAGTSNSRFS
jgi:CRISPR-associated protein Csm3